jgi:endonuclease/exonuclease/phosphatase family metal-dependent hydrolase
MIIAKMLKILLCFIGGLALMVVIALFVFILTQYRPKDKEIIFTTNKPDTLNLHTPINIMSWNIGYAGLGAQMDFFYDGGEQVRPQKPAMQECLAAITAMLDKKDAIDIFLLQEVDKRAKRTYKLNQVKYLAKALPAYEPFYGKNYDVAFVPIPLHNPLGKVNSGLLTLSGLQPKKVIRWSLPGKYSWPKRLFMLKRCMLSHHYPLESGNELIMINLHLSAFDNGALKSKQMAFLKDFCLREYEKGNCIIAGGDWNQLPPGFTPDFDHHVVNNSLPAISPGYFPTGWQWVFDPAVPTNRSLNQPFNKQTTQTNVVDYFLASPNVKVQHIETTHLQFQWSDHQPVKAGFLLQGRD